MKKMKKMTALLIATVMMVAMVVPAMAANERQNGAPATDKYIELTNPSAGHTYELYQVFTGTFAQIDGKDTLGNIAWGTGVTPADGKVNGKTAEETAKAITYSEAGAREFANSFDTYLKGTHTDKTAAATNPTALKWENLSEGYYIIKDVTTNLAEGDEKDLVIVQVLDNVTIAAKAGTVEFDKKVADRNDSTMKPAVYDAWGNTSDYDVNDDVPYQVTIKLPANFSSYKTYQMTMHDDMEAGLVFNDDVEVYVGTTTTKLTKGTDYTVEKNSNGHTFEIAFAEVVGLNGAADNAVYTITYSAKLTGENVVYGNPGNHNEAWLTYSNNPVTGGEGGTTPKKITVTFTYKVEVDKVDENNNPLDGAAFKLEKKIMAADGKTSWTDLGMVEGGSGTIFTFDGLDDGDYRITETATPAGYNKIDPIYFTVAATHGEELTVLTATQTGTTGETLDTDKVTATFSTTLTKIEDGKDAGLIYTDITNKKGAVLPSTGGIGTTIFYVIGAILVLGAGVLLVSRKRMSTK